MGSILEQQLQELQEKIAMIAIYKAMLTWKDIPEIDDKYAHTSSSEKILASLKEFCSKQIAALENGGSQRQDTDLKTEKTADPLDQIKSMLASLINLPTNPDLWNKVNQQGAKSNPPPIVDQFKGKTFKLVGLSNIMPSKMSKILNGSETVQVLEVDNDAIAKVTSGNGLTFFVPTDDLTT